MKDDGTLSNAMAVVAWRRVPSPGVSPAAASTFGSIPKLQEQRRRAEKTWPKLAEFPLKRDFPFRSRRRNPIMIRFSKCLNILIDGAEFLNDRHRPKALPLDSKCKGRDQYESVVYLLLEQLSM